MYYRLPEAQFLKLVPDGESLPRWNSPLNVASNRQKTK